MKWYLLQLIVARLQSLWSLHHELLRVGITSKEFI